MQAQCTWQFELPSGNDGGENADVILEFDLDRQDGGEAGVVEREHVVQRWLDDDERRAATRHTSGQGIVHACRRHLQNIIRALVGWLNWRDYQLAD